MAQRPYNKSHFCDFCQTAPCKVGQRDLAERVLAAVKAEMEGVDDLPWRRGVEAALTAVQRVFTESGVEVDLTTPQKGKVK